MPDVIVDDADNFGFSVDISTSLNVQRVLSPKIEASVWGN
jgi:hypothetical protein